MRAISVDLPRGILDDSRAMDAPRTASYMELQPAYIHIFSELIDPKTGVLCYDDAMFDWATREFSKVLQKAGWTWWEWNAAERSRRQLSNLLAASGANRADIVAQIVAGSRLERMAPLVPVHE